MKKEIPSNNRPENGAWRDALARLRAEGRVRGDGTVLSPNGEDSVLYRTLLDETGNRDEALKLYAMVHTPAFKAWFGNWERKIVEDSVFDKPPTTIRVPEAWKSLGIKELRDRIEAELIDMANGPDPLVHPVLGDVSISKGTGVKKIINASRDPAKLFVAGDLRNAFGASRLFEEEPAATAGKNIKSFERTLAKVSIGGTSLVAIFTVRRLTDGRQFYNTVTLNEVTPAVSLRDTPASRERATSAFAEVSAYIRQDYARVNPDSVSKVVDANGEPLVVWHGTGRYGKADEFDTFRSQATVPVYRVDGAEVKRLDSDGASISQYDDATLSDGYHYGALTDALTMGPEAALAFRLDESRAFPSRDGKESRHVADIRRLQGKIVTQDSETKPTGDGFYFSANQGYGIVARSQVKIPAFLNLKDPADLSEAAIEFAGSSWKSRQLASQGYDGAAYHHYDSRRFEQVVVFKPTQVKHATRNNGDFSNAAPSFLRMGAAPSIAQASLPAERLGKFVEAASALIGEGIRTPQALAEGLDRLAPGGQLRQYSQAFWDAFGMVDNTLRGTHDWDAVYNPPASAAAEAAFIEMSPENEIDALVLERMVPPEFPEGFTAQSVRRLLSGDPAASIRANGSIRRLLDAGKINTRRDGSFEVVTSRVTDQEDAPVEDGVVNTIAGRMSLTEFEAKGYAPEQVTVEDWINLQRAERRRLGQPEGGDNARDPWVEYREFHADAVERAVQAGETVDPEVLEFYPNLAADQLLRTPTESAIYTGTTRQGSDGAIIRRTPAGEYEVRIGNDRTLMPQAQAATTFGLKRAEIEALPDFAKPAPVAFTHDGFKITPTKIQKANGTVEDRWQVQSVENRERELRGERPVPGDTLLLTREQAIREAELQTRKLEDDVRRLDQTAAQDEAAQAAAQPLQDYLDAAGLTGVARGRAQSVLENVKNIRNTDTGKIYGGTRFENLRDVIRDGGRVEMRTGGNSADSYRLYSSADIFWGITKTEYEAGLYLAGLAEQSTSPAEADSATAEADSVPLGFGAQSLRLAELLAGRIRRKEKTSIQQLSSLAAEIFGGSTGTGFDIKTAYDAVEMAINTLVLDSRILIDASPWEAARNLEGIREWLEYIPTQTRRTGEMDALQQFSTPPHFAYIAAWVAGVNSRDVGLEPSAGLGGLASFMHRAGAQVVLNELSDRRRKMLDTLDIGRPATGHDAGLLHAILLPSINSGAIPQPTVVVMNPPFSNSAAGRKDLLTGGYHIDEALKLLAPSGRLVAIVGEGMSMDAPRYRDWWRKVESKYAVRANIHVDGREYTKYGTSFSNRILVIDKIAPTGEPIVQGEVRTIEELIPLLNPVRIARPEINERGIPDNPPPSDQPSSLDEDAERVNDTADLSGSADSSLGTARPGAGGRGGRSRRTGSRGGRRGADGGSNASSGVSTDAAASNDGRSEDAGRQDTGGTQGTVGSDLTSEVGEAEKAEVDANEIFSDYRPRKVRIKGAQPHPSSLVESSSMASVELPDNPILPNIPAEVVSEGAISSAQLEAVAYAALAHETVFEDGRRQGFFIGDGTGVGKGREIAGVIFHNWREGRKKAIWISEKKGLYEDAGRDFRGIGAGDIPLIDMASKIATPEGDGVAFLTYDSLKGNFSGLNPLRPRPFGGKGAEGVKKEIPSN